MQLTIEIDESLYAELEAVAKTQQCSPGQALERVVSSLLPRSTAEQGDRPLPAQHHGYRLPVSKGELPFSTSDVRREEEAHDVRCAA